MQTKKRVKKVLTPISLVVGVGGDFPGFRLDAVVLVDPSVPIPNRVKRDAFRRPLIKMLDRAFPDTDFARPELGNWPGKA